MANDRILRTYDPKMITITFGSVIMTGFADGTFAEVTGEDLFEATTGADGSEDRVNTNQTGVDVSITLKQTSITNDALSTIVNSDKQNNDGVKPFTIKDQRGSTLVFSAQAYIKKHPDLTRSRTSEGHTWEFRLTQITQISGGNL
jgi:hypothetical protein